MDTTKNNRLIAEFLGANLYDPSDYEMYGIIPTIEDGEHEKHFFRPKEMLFHEDWNWVMIVVEKIEGIREQDDTFYNVQILGGLTVYIINSKMEEILEVHDQNSKLLTVYRAVVEFINFYNETK